MRFDVITLFPELFVPFLQVGVTRRAFESGQINVRLWQPRDFAQGNYRRVDDRPFGGGPGMLMQAEPLAQCIEAIWADRAITDDPNCPVVLFSPQGQVLKHSQVAAWAQAKASPPVSLAATPAGAPSDGSGAILLCGRYEGIDQRLIDKYVTHQISLGDFVLSGGEIPAMAFLDAIARLQPGVLGDAQSHVQDSFNPELAGLLDCPHYTRPEVWRGQSVPAVLLGGNHAQIEAWRAEQRVQLTQKFRPDLLP